MARFNLIDERWIPCVMLANGSYDELSLRDALVRAHKIREIFDMSPLVTASLHRLLLAVLHRNFGPRNRSAWKALWQARRWDAEALDEYFANCYMAFDLFDEERPFYQVPDMIGVRQQSVSVLAQELASANNTTLFDHSFDDLQQEVPAKVVARYLIARQAYSLGGGVSRPFNLSHSSLVRGFVVMALGSNLFETLALNLLRYNASEPVPTTEKDCPAWEQINRESPDPAGTEPHGYLDYLTWQSRRIHLYPEDDGLVVRWCQLQQNLKLPERGINDEPYDPFITYVKDATKDPKKNRGWLPLRIQPDKALWRDSHVLFASSRQDSSRAKLFNWLAEIDQLRGEHEIDARAQYSLAAFGLATDPGQAAKVLTWRHERLPLPLNYLDDEVLVTKLSEALAVADRAGSALAAIAKQLQELVTAPTREPDDRRKERRELRRSLNPADVYWARLEVRFRTLLVNLARDREVDEDGVVFYGGTVLPGWKDDVWSAATRALDEITLGLDTNARTLQGVVEAKGNLRRRLGIILGKHGVRREANT